jgi:hypothetical protein
MTQKQRFTILGTTMVFAGVVLAVMLIRSPVVKAHDDDDEVSLIKIGFEIAPVHLNLEGKDRALVGLGSFIVNAQGDCNGCHTAGGPPNFNYANGGNPYFLNQGPTKTDPTTYLAGGTDFFSAVPPSAAVGGFPPGSQPPSYPPPEYGEYVGPDIISRNLTPDKTGRPEGGNTLSEFKQIMRKGTDFDHLHPTCTAALPTPTPANCIPPPVDGSLLQVMPWPVFHNMTDHQIEAIYEYLSAIPCIEGPAQPSDLPPPLQYAFPVLHNDCGGDPPVGQDSHAAARRRTKP